MNLISLSLCHAFSKEWKFNNPVNKVREWTNRANEYKKHLHDLKKKYHGLESKATDYYEQIVNLKKELSECKSAQAAPPSGAL